MIGKTSRQTIREALLQASPLLQPKQITCAADRDLGRLEAEILLSFILKKDKVWLIAHGEQTLSPALQRKFKALVSRRQKHEPIAHLIGEREFYGRTFVVNKDVLIPRPETELIIERVVRRSGGQAVVLWDVGTGSGAIALTLAAEISDAKILATDISSRALTIAKKNAKKIGVTKQVTFIKSNLLQPAAYRWLKRHAVSDHRTVSRAERSGTEGTKPPDHPALIITANLPYLPTSDRKILTPDVVKYEPSLALFSGSDGLTLIKKFLAQLSRHLPEWGYASTTILLEYDPPQTNALTMIAKKYFPEADISIHTDLAGRDRVMEIAIEKKK
jgi:release factor glutamine methyltransferase